jgi:NAD(P)H-dependent FMN reductase
MLKIGLIVGSTLPNRFADVPARWIEEGASRRAGIQLETLDLRELRSPRFDEPAPPSCAVGVYTHAEAEAWRRKVGEFDGFIATVAEYNRGPTAVLRSAFDSAYREWRRKPIAFVGYGGEGGAHAIERLRAAAIEFQMAPLKHEVNVGMAPLLGVLRQNKSLDDFADLVQGRQALFDNLVWWAHALSDARAERRLAA